MSASDVIRKASQHRVSVYEAAKMVYQYEKATGIEKCSNCKNSTKVQYRDRTALQCDIIGICGNTDADISSGFKCAEYKRRK